MSLGCQTPEIVTQHPRTSRPADSRMQRCKEKHVTWDNKGWILAVRSDPKNHHSEDVAARFYQETRNLLSAFLSAHFHTLLGSSVRPCNTVSFKTQVQRDLDLAPQSLSKSTFLNLSAEFHCYIFWQE